MMQRLTLSCLKKLARSEASGVFYGAEALGSGRRGESIREVAGTREKNALGGRSGCRLQSRTFRGDLRHLKNFRRHQGGSKARQTVLDRLLRTLNTQASWSPASGADTPAIFVSRVPRMQPIDHWPLVGLIEKG